MSRAVAVAERKRSEPTAHAVAYWGLLLFTVLLYLRPNDLLPIGTFPLLKILTIATLVVFFLERFGQGGALSVMPRPFRYLLGIAALGIVSIPIGLDPGASLDSFVDLFLKILLIFMLMINVVTSFRRLRTLVAVCVLAGAGVAALTLVDYLQGKNMVEGGRAAGAVGGIFANPNDLALALNVLLPLAMGLVLSRPHPLAKLVYGSCAVVMLLTSMATQSRAGFVTVMIAGAFFLLNLGRRYRAAWAVGLVAAVIFLASSPGRVFVIFSGSDGQLTAAESASQRWALVTRSIEVAGANPFRWLFGVGMNNFSIVSHKDLVNHNSYLQVFNEIGLPALILYLLFLASVLHSTGTVIRRHLHTRGYRQVWLMALAIQTSLVAYAVGSAFASVAFLWYLYYPAGFAVCLQQLLAREQLPARKEVAPRVWYLRRVQH